MRGGKIEKFQINSVFFCLTFFCLVFLHHLQSPLSERTITIRIALLFRRGRKEVLPNIVTRTDRRLRSPFVYGAPGVMSEICRQPERIRFAAHYDDIDVLGLVIWRD